MKTDPSIDKVEVEGVIRRWRYVDDRDARLGDSAASTEAQAARNTWVNRQRAIAAGWTADEWDSFVALGVYPKRKEVNEEQVHVKRDSVY